MGAVEIAVIVIVAVAFAGVAGWLIYRKVKHKGGCAGCDCGCGGGAGCPHCKNADKKDRKSVV